MSQESFEQRLERQRAERRSDAEKARKERQMNSAKRDAQRNYINTETKDLAERRFSELRAPSQPAGKAKSADAPPASGNPIEFYVYKDGELITLKLLSI